MRRTREEIAQILANFQTQLQGSQQSESQNECSRARDEDDQNHPHPEDLSFEKVFKSIDRHRPKNFSVAYAPNEAQEWIERLQSIYAAIVCTIYQKTYMLSFFILKDLR